MRTFFNNMQLSAALALPADAPDAFRFLPAFGPAEFICSDCFNRVALPTDKGFGGTNYATLPADDTALICYGCCAKRTAAEMTETGLAYLYLTGGEHGEYTVTDWPGKLTFKAYGRKGRHNIARVRHDVWFRHEGTKWHGVQIGDNTQIVRCKRVKG